MIIASYTHTYTTHENIYGSSRYHLLALSLCSSNFFIYKQPLLEKTMLLLQVMVEVSTAYRTPLVHATSIISSLIESHILNVFWIVEIWLSLKIKTYLLLIILIWEVVFMLENISFTWETKSWRKPL